MGLINGSANSRSSVLPSRSKTDDSCNSISYIHRCPFVHCEHDIQYSHEVQCQSNGIKINLGTSNCRSTDLWTTEPKSQFISRGNSTNPIVTIDYRNRAIDYLTTKMGVNEFVDPLLHHRLMSSIKNLEYQVYKSSASKDNYIENLAKKLFLIFEELNRRTETNLDTSI